MSSSPTLPSLDALFFPHDVCVLWLCVVNLRGPSPNKLRLQSSLSPINHLHPTKPHHHIELWHLAALAMALARSALILGRNSSNINGAAGGMGWYYCCVCVLCGCVLLICEWRKSTTHTLRQHRHIIYAWEANEGGIKREGNLLSFCAIGGVKNITIVVVKFTC